MATGVVVALAALDVHRFAFPVGLLLAVATSYAVPWWLIGTRHPRTAASFSVGWLALLGLALAGRPEGDYVVAADPAGYVLMVAGFGLVLVGVVGFTGGRRSST